MTNTNEPWPRSAFDEFYDLHPLMDRCSECGDFLPRDPERLMCATCTLWWTQES